MMLDFSFWHTIIILTAMTIVLVKEIFEPEFAIFSVLLLLVIGKVIDVKEALVGFSNRGMLTVGILFVVADALKQTGMLNKLGNFLLGKG